jgi:hypothetical protein
MMFEAFERNYRPDRELRPRSLEAHAKSQIADLSELVDRFGGASFNQSIYRVIRSKDRDEWASRIALAFPEFRGRITCFGYDWLGRGFAIDSQRLEGGRHGVVMFEPGTGQALEVPSNVETFHDDELVNFGDAALAFDFYRHWRASGGAQPEHTQCVGYRKPLFLGGKDDVDNLELSDLDVYWHILGQLITKTKGLPIGTAVRVKLG